MASLLPQIPAKRHFTIGEVADLCDVKPHVLRYWEQEFTQLRPMKRRGNRRYYQHHEVLMRSEEHTSELQSPCNLVCRLLLEKKKTSSVLAAAITYKFERLHAVLLELRLPAPSLVALPAMND